MVMNLTDAYKLVLNDLHSRSKLNETILSTLEPILDSLVSSKIEQNNPKVEPVKNLLGVSVKDLVAELSAIEDQNQQIVYDYHTFTDLVETYGFHNLTPDLLKEFIDDAGDEYFLLTFMEGGSGFYDDLCEFLEEETGEGNTEDEMFGWSRD
jgi:predicted RNA-binding protein with EMAP domain